MNDQVRAIVIRNRRHLLLQILADQEDGPTVDGDSLRAVMSSLGMPTTRSEFRDLIGYLSDAQKKYVRMDRRKMGHTEVTLVTLTAAGKDIVDGTSCDPGIGQGCPDAPED